MTARALAPLPWRAGERGFVVDATGDVVARLAARLNCDDDESWRELTAELAAAPDMRAALAELLYDIDNSPTTRLMQGSAAYRAAALALAKASGRR